MAAEEICWIIQHVAKQMMDDVERSNRVINDDLCQASANLTE